jgi:hypothetical protein
MGDVLESAINDDQRLKMINAEGTNKIKASTQWHDPGLFAVLISMPRSDIRFNRFICGGSLYTDRRQTWRFMPPPFGSQP